MRITSVIEYNGEPAIRITDTPTTEALQYIADHGKVTVGNVATMLMVDMEITPAQAQEIIISLVADGKVHYQPAYLEVRE